MGKEVDIIIISNANTSSARKLTEDCILSLYSSEKTIKFNTFIVESNKNEQFTNLLNRFNIKLIHPRETFGYHKYLNIGISMGKSEYVCLCNNDLIFHKNWASNLIFEMEKNSLLSVSPISNNPHLTKFKIENIPHVQLGYDIRRYLAGWCIFQKRKIYDIIGKLDERFIFWYCDNDYSMTLQNAKIQHALITTSRVDHIESATLNTVNREERQHLTRDQEVIFKNKWNL